jgi:hypothetical protein
MGSEWSLVYRIHIRRFYSSLGDLVSFQEQLQPPVTPPGELGYPAQHAVTWCIALGTRKRNDREPAEIARAGRLPTNRKPFVSGTDGNIGKQMVEMRYPTPFIAMPVQARRRGGQEAMQAKDSQRAM